MLQKLRVMPAYNCCALGLLSADLRFRSFGNRWCCNRLISSVRNSTGCRSRSWHGALRFYDHSAKRAARPGPVSGSQQPGLGSLYICKDVPGSIATRWLRDRSARTEQGRRQCKQSTEVRDCLRYLEKPNLRNQKLEPDTL